MSSAFTGVLVTPLGAGSAPLTVTAFDLVFAGLAALPASLTFAAATPFGFAALLAPLVIATGNDSALWSPTMSSKVGSRSLVFVAGTFASAPPLPFATLPGRGSGSEDFVGRGLTRF